MTPKELEEFLKLMDKYKVTSLSINGAAISKQLPAPTLAAPKTKKSKSLDASDELLAIMQGKEDDES